MRSKINSISTTKNIRQAFENFMEARALVREARSQYFPTVA